MQELLRSKWGHDRRSQNLKFWGVESQKAANELESRLRMQNLFSGLRAKKEVLNLQFLTAFNFLTSETNSDASLKNEWTARESFRVKFLFFSSFFQDSKALSAHRRVWNCKIFHFNRTPPTIIRTKVPAKVCLKRRFEAQIKAQLFRVSPPPPNFFRYFSFLFFFLSLIIAFYIKNWGYKVKFHLPLSRPQSILLLYKI